MSPELRELSGRLVEHFRRRNLRRNELDQLIVADPPSALALLRELYREADAQFDAPACQGLLDLVHARASLGGWELVKEQNRLERYLVARTYWRERYRQASRFLPPQGTEDAFRDLLDDDGPNRLQIFAAGGMGKTIHLYELIARRAVPEPARLACALIDFDLTQVGNVVRDPWLVLIEVAHQLNQQLDEPLFDDFLKQYGPLRARLLLPQFTVEAAIPGQIGGNSDAERERLREGVRRDFFGVLQPAIAGRVLIAFDTLEDVTHLGPYAAAPGARRAFVEQLTALAHRLPAARIVLSGRFDLRCDIEDLDARFGPIAHLALNRLDANEARSYLRTRRKLDVGDDVINAAIAASGASGEGAQPLILAMIADVIALELNIAADVVRQLDEPQLYYLIERVVIRIPDVRVRWLLRYGVVPRLLTREFVEDVVLPFVRNAIAGPTEDDNPDRDRRPTRGTDQDPFPFALGAVLDADELWAQLKRYAAAYSWVEAVEEDVLRFHEIVVGAMRDLLRQQPVFAKLNQDASEYFERRAQEDPGDRARLLREAFYHRLVLDVDGAIAGWRQRTRSTATDPDVAAALADEVLDLAVREPDRLGRDVVAQARVERALANLRLVTAPGAARDSRLWDLAREDVEQAACLIPEDDSRLTACRASLLVLDGAPDKALELVASRLAEHPRAEDELILHVRRAEALASIGESGAEAEYRAAIALGPGTGLRPVDLGTLHWKRAQALENCDAIAAARAACEQGLSIAPESSSAHAALLLLRGRLSLRMGNPTAAAPSAAAPRKRGGRLRHEANLLLATAELAAWDAEQALALAEDAVTDARGRNLNAAEAGIELAEARELRAAVRAALGDARPAQEDLEAAALIWDSISSDGARRCFAEIAKIQLRRVADLQRTDVALQRAEAVSAERSGARLGGVLAERPGVDLGTVRLRRAEWQASAGIGNPEALVMDVVDELRARKAPPGVRARAALEGLCLPARDLRSRFLAELNQALGDVEPAAARLAMLDDLDRCPSLKGLRRENVRRLGALLVLDDVDALPVRDRRVALIRLADVARIVGEEEQSRRLVHAAHKLEAEAGYTPFARLQLALAAVRVGHETLAERIGLPELSVADAGERHGLDTPSFISTAEDLLLRGDRFRDMAARALALARRLRELGRQPPPTPPAAAAPPRRLRPTIRTDHPTVDIFLKLEDGALAVRAQPPSGDASRDERFTSDDSFVVGAIVRAASRPGTLDPELSDLLSKSTAAPSLADVLLLGARAGDLLPGDGPVDVRLWTEGPSLAMIPWELAASGDERRLTADSRIRHMYRGVLDAEPGPPPAQNPPPRPPGPTAVIVRPEVGDRREPRGMIKMTLVPLERQYASAGMRVHVLESVALTALGSCLAEERPDVLHVAAGFVDAGGGPAIDVSSGVAGLLELPDIDLDRLTTSGLAAAVIATGWPAPVIVLDPPAVPNVTVQATQLLLRNAFAAEVAAVVGVPAVIATGLVRYGCQDMLYGFLPRELASGRPVVDVVDGIRALTTSACDTADAFGFAPTALFAARPGHIIGAPA